MARQMNEEEFAKFLGTFVQAVWQQLVQVSQRPGQARAFPAARCQSPMRPEHSPLGKTCQGSAKLVVIQKVPCRWLPCSKVQVTILGACLVRGVRAFTLCPGRARFA